LNHVREVVISRAIQPITVALALTIAGNMSADILPLPFAGNFGIGKLDAGWATHFDTNNVMVIAGDTLEFSARAHTSARIERPLGQDCIRVSCALKSDDGLTPSLLSLNWDESNFIQLGLNEPAGSKLNVREVLGTYPHDYELGDVKPGKWQFVAIEMARDCIRYFASTDGVSFEKVLVCPRPLRFAGAPALLTLGQDSKGKMFERPNPWIVYPTTEFGTNEIRDLRVESLPKTALYATDAERHQLATQERDLAGEAELASENDPSFASVSRHFPGMKWPREIVGVKDHPFDIGIAPDGSMQLSDNIASYGKPAAWFQIGDYRFGSGQVSCSKRLLDGWMPIVVATDSQDGLEMEETILGWSRNFSPDEPLMGYVQFSVTNKTDRARAATVQLVFSDRSRAVTPLRWQFDLAPQGSQTISARVPYKIEELIADKISNDEFQSTLADTKAYWQELIARGSRFDIPEARVQDAYRAWLAYNFLNVAKRNGVYEVCDGSGFYGKVYGYSAALYCNALDLMGYPDFSEGYCDSLLSFLHTNGLLAVNFGDTDTGTALWMMAQHYQLTHDLNWVNRMIPRMRTMCRWIVGQRHAALENVNREPLATRGLIRFQPYADLLHPAADYFSNGYLWKGLDAAAQLFALAGRPDEAAEFQHEADNYRKDLDASMNAAVFSDSGQRILPMIPDTHELWKESDSSADGYYGLIAPCLLEIGLPLDKAKLISDALETRGGLVAGITQFHRMADHAYTYGYWINCLQRDDVKRAILGLYGSLAYGMSRDTYAATECTMIQTGENYWMLPHTYSNTQQLRLLRNMLVREEGDTLWLGQAIPRDWLQPGQRVAVSEAPTTFGPVSYSIEPQADGSMRVTLSPPTRNRPKEIILRLRDVKHRRIARIKPQGEMKVKFSDETVRLAGGDSPVTLDVSFQ